MVPFDGRGSGWVQVPDPPPPFPFKAWGQESFPLPLFLSAPPFPVHTSVNIPIIQCASITLSVELTSLELTALAVHHLFAAGPLPETDLID